MAAADSRSARRFLRGLPNLDVAGRRILDVHSDHEPLGRLLAERGAREVVGVATPDVGDATAEAPYDLVISRGGLGGAAGADAHLARLSAALAPEGTLVIAFSPRRRIAARAGRPGLTVEMFADVMARSRLHCTWYRVRRVPAYAPILGTAVVSMWRQPLL